MFEELDVVNLLILQFMERGTDEIRCLILKFLTCLITESTLLTPQELETLVLKNTAALTQWYVYERFFSPLLIFRSIWKFYDMQRPEVNDLRSVLLLRTIVVDVRAFEALLREHLQAEGQTDSG